MACVNLHDVNSDLISIDVNDLLFYRSIYMASLACIRYRIHYRITIFCTVESIDSVNIATIEI